MYTKFDKRLLITYQDSFGEATQREVSQLIVRSRYMFTAYCHLRAAERGFAFDRIESAKDLETEQYIDDLRNYLDIPAPGEPRRMPVFAETPQSISEEEAKSLRNGDKSRLEISFKFVRVKGTLKKTLSELFDNKCAACGKTSSQLVLDHHIPQYLGGRLVPGNISLLCSKCNSDKGITHPKYFYSQEKLEYIQHALYAELELFDA